MKYSEQDIDVVACIAHQANKAYCESIGDASQPNWTEAPEWQKASARNGVRFHLDNPKANASASHENWYTEKEADGWSYGPVKDPDNKRHPCFVAYKELPVEQQIKDHIFRSIVHAMSSIRGL